MLVTYFVKFRKLNDHLFGKELFIRFAGSAFRELLSVYVFSYFPFGFDGRMWDLIVSVPDHCFSFYLTFLIWDVLTLIVQNRYHYLACRAKQPRKKSELFTLLLFSMYIWTETPHSPDSFADTLLSYIFVALSIYLV